VLDQGLSELTFRRNFGDRENQEFSELVDMMTGVHLTNSFDSARWILEKSGKFTSSSLYKELTFTGFSDRWMLSLWKTKVPLKIKIFLSHIIRDKFNLLIN
jgi:hypothetical protein